MGILIGADFVPTDSNITLFEKADLNCLVGNELLEMISGADFRIFNLEMPLTDCLKPILKYGPSLIAPKSAVAAYAALKVDLFTLANNHILDQGVEGLESTINVLNENGIKYVGVGETISESKKPYIFEMFDKKVGIYACVEHEFSCASESCFGANPIDELDTPDDISELKNQCDYVIVLYHGGKEYYRYPSPRLQKLCRKLVKKGADLVVCQHSHCIGCKEEYEGGTIVYGQGNFLFDHSNEDCWKTGMLINIDDGFSIQFIPVIKTDNTVRLASETESAEIMKGFLQRSCEITDYSNVKSKYEAFSKTLLDKYLNGFKGKESLVFRSVNKILNNSLRTETIKRKYDKKQLVAIQNFVECEAHRELILCAIKDKVDS